MTSSGGERSVTAVAAASAPGKVLIIGGYLVVEAPHVGVSIGVDARFHAAVDRVACATETRALFGTAVAGGGACEEEAAAGHASLLARTFVITVDSPQFGKTFTFFVAAAAADSSDADERSSTLAIWQSAGATRNPFLAHAIVYVLAFFVGRAGAATVDAVTAVLRQLVAGTNNESAPGHRLHITVRGANDFYSQQNYLAERGIRVSAASLRQVPPFAPLVGSVSKTGLGSSAALTVSVVGALYVACGAALAADPTRASASRDADETETIHRLAQAAHCVAQGKVGSGFDVFTAVYGSCAYSRFPAATIEPLLHAASTATTAAANGGAASLTNCVCVDPAVLASTVGHPRLRGAAADAASGDAGWVPRALLGSFRRLPPRITLMLADVHAGGTETPSMVQKIFAWRKTLDAGDAANPWNGLAAANVACISALEALDRAASENGAAYDAAARVAASAPSASSATDVSDVAPDVAAVVRLFDATRAALADSRARLRDVGVRAGVEVEPPRLTPLLDRSLGATPGVLAVGCPGAGGYDAVFALVVDVGDAGVASGGGGSGGDGSTSNSNSARLEAFWESYESDGLHVCPLLVREAGAGLQLN